MNTAKRYTNNMKKLPADWQPSAETLRILKLNELPDQHIAASVDFFVTKFVNTSIDEVDNYDNWASLFLMFAVKSYRQMNPEAPIPSVEDFQ